MATPTVTRAAANRTQGKAPGRYLNKASGKMETRQQMGSYRQPQGHPAPRQGSTTTRSTTTRTAAPAQAPSLIQMTPAQIEDRAKRIVNSEAAAERLPYQQRQAQLAAEEPGVQAAHNATSQQLAAGTQGLQTKAADSAKTFQNVAADMVKRAESATPGGAEAAERLGGAPAPGSALARQQEAARTLLTGIASAAQSGTNARQQAESNFLTSLQGTEAQNAAAGTQQIASDYAKSKQSSANEEARVNASKPGRVGKLALGMQGEQEKLRIAAQGLNLKGAEAERHSEETRSNVSNRQQTQKLNNRKLGLSERKQGADEEYKKASLGNKQLKDSLDIKKKEVDIKNAIEKHNGTNGKPITKQQVAKFTSELSAAFQVFQRGRAAGASPAQIRESLEQGGHRYTPTEKEIADEQKQKGITFTPTELRDKRKGYFLKGATVRNPAFLKAAEDIMQKEYVSAETKKELRELGLPDSGWSDRFIKHSAPTPPKGLKRGK